MMARGAHERFPVMSASKEEVDFSAVVTCAGAFPGTVATIISDTAQGITARFALSSVLELIIPFKVAKDNGVQVTLRPGTADPDGLCVSAKTYTDVTSPYHTVIQIRLTDGATKALTAWDTFGCNVFAKVKRVDVK